MRKNTKELIFLITTAYLIKLTYIIGSYQLSKIYKQLFFKESYDRWYLIFLPLGIFLLFFLVNFQIVSLLAEIYNCSSSIIITVTSL